MTPHIPVLFFLLSQESVWFWFCTLKNDLGKHKFVEQEIVEEDGSHIDILDYNLDRSTTSSVLKSILSVDTETQTT